jgi:uncharacterized membrane protein YbjE (DUF340 family)
MEGQQLRSTFVGWVFVHLYIWYVFKDWLSEAVEFIAQTGYFFIYNRALVVAFVIAVIAALVSALSDSLLAVLSPIRAVVTFSVASLLVLMLIPNATSRKWECEKSWAPEKKASYNQHRAPFSHLGTW